MEVRLLGRREAYLMTISVEDYGKFFDRHWRAVKVTMIDLLTGESIVLLWSDFEFGTDSSRATSQPQC